MNKTLYISLIYVVCSFFTLHSQVEVDKNIEFNNVNINLKNIFNVGFPIDSADGVSIKNGFLYSVTFYETQGNENQINLTTNINDLNLVAGLSIKFKPLLTNTDSVFISLNGQGNYNLYKYRNAPLDSADLTSDRIVEIVYDGNNFQLLSIGDNVCPIGFIEVDEGFCIEEESHEPLNFFDATKYCMDKNARLCKWSEFSMACEILNTGSNDFTDTWEWVSASSDHSNGAKIVGNGSCDSNDFYNAELNFARFRCCYNK